MRRRVDLRIEKTLLVDGPATVRVVSGMVNVMGTIYTEGSLVKVRGFRRMPFYTEHSEASLIIDGGKYRVLDGSTIPSSWIEAAEKTASEEGIIAVVGGSDSGKTSLATFLINYYLNFQGEVGVVDADPGQNDLGVPGTINAGIVNKGLSDLCQVKPEAIEFIGLTAPESGVEELKEAITAIVGKLRKRGVEKIVLNTDGWIDSKGLSFKAELIRIVKPSSVVSLLEGEEAIMFANMIDPGTKIIHVERSPYVKKRNRVQRRMLRTLNYRRHFAKSRLVKKTLSETVFQNHPFINGEPVPPPEDLKGLGFTVLETKLYMNTLYVKIEDEVDEPIAIEVNGRRAIMLSKGWEKGLLVGLGKEGRTIGVGVIDSVSDHEVIVKTPLVTEFDTVKLGEIKLDIDFNEKSFCWRPSRHRD